MIRSLFRRLPAADDALPGDFVRRAGTTGVGLIESISADHAVVAWDRDRRDILPLAVLRVVDRPTDRHLGDRP